MLRPSLHINTYSRSNFGSLLVQKTFTKSFSTPVFSHNPTWIAIHSLGSWRLGYATSYSLSMEGAWNPSSLPSLPRLAPALCHLISQLPRFPFLAEAATGRPGMGTTVQPGQSPGWPSELDQEASGQTLGLRASGRKTVGCGQCDL